MINIFSAFMGTILFVEILSVLALLKPIKEPYIIRDLWCKFEGNYYVNIICSIIFLLSINTFFEISWENGFYQQLLWNNKGSPMISEFYKSKMSMCFTCFFMAVYLIILIDRLIHILTMIARLLEFELMCRYAILTREPTQVTMTSANASEAKHNIVKDYIINPE